MKNNISRIVNINKVSSDRNTKNQLEAINEIAYLSCLRKNNNYIPTQWKYNVKSAILHISNIIYNENLLESIDISKRDVAAILLAYRMKGDLVNSIKETVLFNFKIDTPEDKKAFIDSCYLAYEKYYNELSRKVCMDEEDENDEIELEEDQECIYDSTNYETGAKALLNREFKKVLRDSLLLKKDLILEENWDELAKFEEKEKRLKVLITNNIIKRDEDIRSLAGYIDMFMHAVNASNTQIDIKEFAKELNLRLYQHGTYTDNKAEFRKETVDLVGLKIDAEKPEKIDKRFDLLQAQLDAIYENEGSMQNDEYITRVVKIASEWIQIQPFFDGNKRTARAFLNMMFIHKGMPPICIPVNEKKEYNKNLEYAFQPDRVTYNLENCEGLEEYIKDKVVEATYAVNGLDNNKMINNNNIQEYENIAL